MSSKSKVKFCHGLYLNAQYTACLKNIYMYPSKISPIFKSHIWTLPEKYKNTKIKFKNELKCFFPNHRGRSLYIFTTIDNSVISIYSFSHSF